MQAIQPKLNRPTGRSGSKFVLGNAIAGIAGGGGAIAGGNYLHPVVHKSKPIPTQQVATASDIRNAKMEAHKVFNSLPNLNQTHVTIGLFSREEMEKMSVCTITSNKTESGMQTINDPKMGDPNSSKACATCSMYDCPGHFGYIRFGLPILSPVYISSIISVLSCVCPHCGDMYLKEDYIRSNFTSTRGNKRLTELAKASAPLKCNNRFTGPGGSVITCKSSYKYDNAASKEMGMIVYTIVGSKEVNKITMPNTKVLDIFKSISNNNAILMGFKSNVVPVSMVMEGMLVPPPIARQPKIVNDTIKENDMSILLKKIVTANNDLIAANRNANMNRGDSVVDCIKGLYNTIIEYNNHIIGLIQGKDALMRGNNMAKRGNFSGRGVIGPDDNIRPDQIGIPIRVAKKLTPTVLVTPENRSEILALHAKGMITHATPGSGKFEGHERQLFEGIDYTPRVGDTVRRWLQNGDMIVLGRQPTLHKNGLMAHEVFVYNDDSSVIRMNLSVTGAYNADFDGDEGNLNLATTRESLEDLENLMAVKHNTISAQDNRPILGLTYDSITGAYLLTNFEHHFNQNMVNDAYLTMIEDSQLITLQDRLRSLGVDPLSGKGLISATFPEDFIYKKGDVRIVKGVMITGTLTSTHVGTSSRSIVQEINTRYGPVRAISWINDAMKVIRRFLYSYGISVGYEDCSYGETPESVKIVQEAIELANAKMAVLGPYPEDELAKLDYERKVSTIVSETKEVGLNLAKHGMKETNPIRYMNLSGAKGSDFNSAQIGGILGQQTNDNKRIFAGRSTSYQQGEVDLRDGGFCMGSFFQGLDPADFFAHQVGGRDGLAVTGASLSDVGTFHRFVAKATENLVTYPDGSVRNTSGVAFQNSYGQDGLDPEKLFIVNGPGDTRKRSFIDLGDLASSINAEFGWHNLPEGTDFTKL